MRVLHYDFSVTGLEEMKNIVKALIWICKRGESWGQRFLSMRVYRDGNGFSGVMTYETPKGLGL